MYIVMLYEFIKTWKSYDLHKYANSKCADKKFWEKLHPQNWIL